MGFQYCKQKDCYEQPRIIEQRHAIELVVFLDETWANSHDGKDLAWVEKDMATGNTIKCPSGKETHFIFHSKNTGDYHDKITGDHFEEWFRDKLLSNIPLNSLIIMDNASYHS